MFRRKSFQESGDSREKAQPHVCSALSLFPELILRDSRICASLLEIPTNLRTIPAFSQGMKNLAKGTNPDPRRPWQHSLSPYYPHFSSAGILRGSARLWGSSFGHQGTPSVLGALSPFPDGALGRPQSPGRDALIPIHHSFTQRLCHNHLSWEAAAPWCCLCSRAGPNPTCDLELSPQPPLGNSQPLLRFGRDSFHAKIQASALQPLSWSQRPAHHSFPGVCSLSCSAPAPSWFKSRPLQLEAGGINGFKDFPC